MLRMDYVKDKGHTDFIIENGGYNKDEVTKKLRKSCESSPSRYQYYLSEKRKEKRREARKGYKRRFRKGKTISKL